MKWLCLTRRSARGLLIVQATWNLSFVMLMFATGIKGRRGVRTGGGRDQDGQGGGEQGREKNVGCQAWLVGGAEGGGEGRNGLASEKRRGAGPVCSALKVGLWSLWTGGGRKKW